MSQRLLVGFVIPGDAVSCIHAEPAVVPVHELLDEIISYPALAFQHGENPGPENFFKLLHLSLGKHIKGPIFTEKAVSDYCMKMRVEPGVISKGVNDHHKALSSVREARHSTKENLKTFPCAIEKNRDAEHKLRVGYWIENIVTYILSKLDHLLLASILLFIFPISSFAFPGKVVGVTDGDTVKILRSDTHTQVKIRLAGICIAHHQDLPC